MNIFENKDYFESIDNDLASCITPTPLLEAHQLKSYFNLNKVYLKLEGSLPFSHTFKDRGAITAINYLLNHNEKKVAFASCGNMGSAIALVAKRKGIQPYAIVSDEASFANMMMVHKSGANYVVYKGRFDEIDSIIADFSSKNPDFPCINTNLMHEYAKGLKSLYYELFESLHDKHKEINVVVPTADGTLLSSLYEGYLHLKDKHKDFVVHFIMVQPSGCAPLVKAFVNNEAIQTWNESTTEVLSLSVNNPFLNGNNALKAVQESRGMAISVNEKYAESMYEMVSRLEGILIDDVGGIVIASLNELSKNSDLNGYPTVCLLTSNGLKTIEKQKGVIIKSAINNKDIVISSLMSD